MRLASLAAAGLTAVALLLLAACDSAAPPPPTAAPPPQIGSEGATCGGFASPPCAKGLYCHKTIDQLRGADIPGACAVVPDTCPDAYQPVCSDDGRTFNNACLAAAQGVNVARDKACQAPQ